MPTDPTSGEPPSLPRVLTHHLLDLASAIDLIGRAAADRLGINQTDLICLNLLTRGGPTSPGQLAAALGLTTAAISAMARRLEAGGYAFREIDPIDRRRVLLHASPAGARQAFSMFDDLYQASVELCAGYEERELRTLTELIARYREIITEHTASVQPEAASRPEPEL